MANKKKQFDQEFKQNAVNYCLTHPELSRKAVSYTHLTLPTT